METVRRAINEFRRAFWVVVVIQAFNETYRRSIWPTAAVWALGTVITFFVVRRFSGSGDAWQDLKAALLIATVLEGLRLSYYALRIPPRLLKDGLKTEVWMTRAEELSRLESRGRDLIRTLTPDSDLSDIKKIREEWRNDVLDLLHRAFSEAWSAQFKHSSGYQREELIAFVGIRTQKIVPHHIKLLSPEREELVEFLTEIEQVREFAKTCYDYAKTGHELLRLK